ncbi:hypothetical protein D3C78_1452600 [compost metagenome]
MLVIKINHLDPETLQAALHRSADVLRSAADAPRCRVGRIAHNAKLGGQKDLLPLALDRFANQLFIGVWAVHVGGIQQRDAQLQRTVQRGDSFLFIVSGRIKITHPHAAQPQSGNQRASGT